MDFKNGDNKNITYGWEISVKNDILTVQETHKSCRGNKKNRCLEITPLERRIESQQSKMENIKLNKHIEKGNISYQI